MTQDDDDAMTIRPASRQSRANEPSADSSFLMFGPDRHGGERERRDDAAIGVDGQIAEEDVTDNRAIDFRNEREAHMAAGAEGVHEFGLVVPAEGEADDLANRLVVRGPYAFIRNPMAFTGLTQATAVALILGSTAVLLYVAAGGSFWNWVVRPFEERDLARRFGEPYERYRRAVRCWVPRITPYRG